MGAPSIIGGLAWIKKIHLYMGDDLFYHYCKQNEIFSNAKGVLYVKTFLDTYKPVIKKEDKEVFKTANDIHTAFSYGSWKGYKC